VPGVWLPVANVRMTKNTIRPTLTVNTIAITTEARELKGFGRARSVGFKVFDRRGCAGTAERSGRHVRQLLRQLVQEEADIGHQAHRL
jgi:hypothetical protein